MPKPYLPQLFPLSLQAGFFRSPIWGGPLDGTEASATLPLVVLAIYRTPRSGDLRVAAHSGTNSPPATRDTAKGPAPLVALCAWAALPNGKIGWRHFATWRGAARAALGSMNAAGPVASGGSQVAPPAVATTLAAEARPPFVGPIARRPLTPAQRETLQDVRDEYVGIICSPLLTRHPVTLEPVDAGLLLAACVRWLEHRTVGGVSPIDQDRLTQHAEYRLSCPEAGRAARVCLDLIASWESIHGDDEEPEDDGDDRGSAA